MKSSSSWLTSPIVTCRTRKMYLSSSTQSISMDLITSFIDIWFLAYREANTCLFSSHIESILCRECVQPSAIHQREWALFIPYSFPTIQYYEDTDWYHAFNTYLTSQSCPRWHRNQYLLNQSVLSKMA